MVNRPTRFAVDVRVVAFDFDVDRRVVL